MDDDLYLDFTGNFVYDAAVVGWEMYADKYGFGKNSLQEIQKGLIWGICGKVPRNKIDEFISEFLIGKQLMKIESMKYELAFVNYVDVDETTNEYFLELKLVVSKKVSKKNRRHKKIYYPTEKWKNFGFSEKDWEKLTKGQQKKMGVEIEEINDQNLEEFLKGEKSLRFSITPTQRATLIPLLKGEAFVKDKVDEEENYVLRLRGKIKEGEIDKLKKFRHSNFNNITFQVTSGNAKFDREGYFRPKSGVMTIGGLKVGLWANEFFVSVGNQPFTYYSKEKEEPPHSEKNIRDKCELTFKYIWPFYHYAFGGELNERTFIYYPYPGKKGRDVCISINKFFHKFRKKKTIESKFALKKALIQALVRLNLYSVLDYFMIVKEYEVDRQKQKVREVIFFSFPKPLLYFTRRFARYSKELLSEWVLVHNTKSETRKDYLAFALSQFSPIQLVEIAFNYKPEEKVRTYDYKSIFRFLTLYQAFLEKLKKEKSNLNPFQPYKEPDYIDVYIDLDKMDIFTGLDVQQKKRYLGYLGSLIKGKQKEKFFSLMIKLAFEQRKVEAFRELEKLMEYKYTWIPAASYFFSKLASEVK